MDMKVKIEEFKFKNNTSTYRGERWRASDLVEEAKDCDVYDMPLIAIDLGVAVWANGLDIADFIYHSKRIQNADLKYPIIQHPDGWILDGWHRVCKAILQGDETIKAVRLDKMPDRFEVVDE